MKYSGRQVPRYLSYGGSMQQIQPNWAVLAAAVARMVIGAVWYSPLLFLRPWQAMAGMSDKDVAKGMARAVAVDLIGSLAMAFVLLHAIRYAGAESLGQGLAVSLV